MSPNKHGIMMEDLKHVLAPRNVLGSETVLPLGGAENLGVTATNRILST